SNISEPRRVEQHTTISRYDSSQLPCTHASCQLELPSAAAKKENLIEKLQLQVADSNANSLALSS
ncbi:MAG: hypothetical protein MJA30_19390, partial [Cytophagales bacterium]|nr:hypothetical protein [Cytophagales bacterium]